MTTEWKDLPTFQDVAEAQAQGWEIEVQMLPSDKFNEWQESVWRSNFMFRGRPRQPKMKKVKSLCWRYSDGDFAWRIEGINLAKPWIRVPSEDKEIEVPA